MMDVKITYPITNDSNVKFLRAKSTLLSVLSVAVVVCCIVNICTGGKSWWAIVLGAELLFWIFFVHRPLIENTFIGRVSVTLVALCMYLALIDVVINGALTWTESVLSTLCFSILIFDGLIFFCSRERQIRNMSALLFLIIACLVFTIVALSGVIAVRWQIIVMGSVALAEAVLGVAIYPNQIKKELQKRLHT